MNSTDTIERAININGMSKKYGKNLILDDISLEVNRGEIFGILGRNGVGKTTFLESIVGLRESDAGVIEILGKDVTNNKKELTNYIGVQPQEAALMQRQTIREIMQLFNSFYKTETDIEKILIDFNMKELENKRVKNLSVGQRQRLLVAITLMGNPEILIFDEPTTGLDPQVRHLIWDNFRALKEVGKTILITTHNMEEAYRLCDRIAILHNGKFVECDKPDTIIKKNTKSLHSTLEDAFINLTGNILREGVD